MTLTHSLSMSASVGDLWATNKETSALPPTGCWALDKSIELSGFSDFLSGPVELS